MVSCDVIHGLRPSLAADSTLMDLKVALGGSSHQQDTCPPPQLRITLGFSLSLGVLAAAWSPAWADGLEPYLGRRKMILFSHRLGVLSAFALW